MTCVCVSLIDNRPVDPPVFTRPLQDCTVDEGGDIILQATVAGGQPIKVSWLHNGENLEDPDSSGVSLRAAAEGSHLVSLVFVLSTGKVASFGQASFNGREVKLVVKESLPEDAGEYTCLAENSAGRTSSCGAVKVRGQ